MNFAKPETVSKSKPTPITYQLHNFPLGQRLTKCIKYPGRVVNANTLTYNIICIPKFLVHL